MSKPVVHLPSAPRFHGLIPASIFGLHRKVAKSLRADFQRARSDVDRGQAGVRMLTYIKGENWIVKYLPIPTELNPDGTPQRMPKRVPYRRPADHPKTLRRTA